MAEESNYERRLLRLPEVKAKTGKCASAIYAEGATGAFPAPIKIGSRASAWVEAEVDAWIAERIRERDGESERGAA